jgi:hypothetical protein
MRDATNGNVLPWYVDSNIDQAVINNNYGMATSNTARNSFSIRGSSSTIINYVDTGNTMRSITSGQLTLTINRNW